MMIGRAAHPDIHAALLRLFAQPQTGLVIAADPAKIGLAQTKHCAVVNHTAMLITHGRIGNAAHRNFFHIARHAELHQRLGVRASDLIFAQRRQIHDHRPLARGPVFGNAAMVGHILGQPVASIFNKVARVPRKTVMKAGFFRFFHISPRGFAPSNRALEIFGFLIGANLNIGRVPAVCRINITWTSR